MNPNNKIEKTNSILKAALVGWWEWNILKDSVYYSPLWYRMLGYEPQGFPSCFEEWRDLLHPDDKKKTITHQAYLMQTEEQWEVEFRMRHKKGHFIWIRSCGVVTARDEEGMPIIIAGIHQDIDQQKKLEARVLKMQEEQDLMNGIIQVSPASYKVYDFLEKRFTYSSDVDYLDLKDKSLKELIHPDDLDAVETHVDKVIRSKDGQVFTFTFRVVPKQGAIKWVFLRNTIFKRNKNGQVYQVIGAVLDITNYKLIKEKVARQVEMLQDISFANAHEIRGQVSTILGLIGLIQDEFTSKGVGVSELKSLIGYLSNTVEKLDEVIHRMNDLLDS